MLRVCGRIILILLAAGLVAGGLYLAVDGFGASALVANGPGRGPALGGEGDRPAPPGFDTAQGGSAARVPGGKLDGPNPNGTGLRPERPAGVGRQGGPEGAGTWQRALPGLLRNVTLMAVIILVVVSIRRVIRWASHKWRRPAALSPAD